MKLQGLKGSERQSSCSPIYLTFHKLCAETALSPGDCQLEGHTGGSKDESRFDIEK